MNNQAERIIQKLGGAHRVALIVNIDVSQVYRWTYSKSRGGTDGLIPSRHHQSLINDAMLKGIDLLPLFFDPAPKRKKKRIRSQEISVGA